MKIQSVKDSPRQSTTARVLVNYHGAHSDGMLATKLV